MPRLPLPSLSPVFRAASAACLALCVAAASFAAVTIPGADGSDGAFAPSANVTVDLSQAPNANWNFASLIPGKGVYDFTQWAVVFKYTSVNIPAGVTVTFKNHPAGAPVVWLVSGNVRIAGSVVLDGEGGGAGGSLTPTEPGAGGFRGGLSGQLSATQASLQPGGGFGPGGSGLTSTYPSPSAGYSVAGSLPSGAGVGSQGPAYGVNTLVPLIGGSGASGYGGSAALGVRGGAGGGALLIAAAGSVRVDGLISANGGAGFNSNGFVPCGGGSGGSVRVVCDSLLGSGRISAVGGTDNNSGGGGDGRIRIETNFPLSSITQFPDGFAGPPGATATLWPTPATPTAQIISINGVGVPADPHGNLSPGAADLLLSAPNPVTITVQTTNVPTSTPVSIHVVPLHGNPAATGNRFALTGSGTTTSATWTRSLTLPDGAFTLQVDVGIAGTP